MKDGTIATSRVSTRKVHGIRTTRSRTLTQVFMICQRQEHEVVVKIVLPEKHFSFFHIVRKTHVARQAVTIDFHIATIGT